MLSPLGSDCSSFAHRIKICIWDVDDGSSALCIEKIRAFIGTGSQLNMGMHHEYRVPLHMPLTH